MGSGRHGSGHRTIKQSISYPAISDIIRQKVNWTFDSFFIKSNLTGSNSKSVYRQLLQVARSNKTRSPVPHLLSRQTTGDSADEEESQVTRNTRDNLYHVHYWGGNWKSSFRRAATYAWNIVWFCIFRSFDLLEGNIFHLLMNIEYDGRDWLWKTSVIK